MSSQPFVYKPLLTSQTIRLLILQPGSNDDPLVCVLEETTLLTNPGYEAISYAWGDRKSDIKVGYGNNHVEVPYNLKLALLRFRRKDEPRRLWADSICINQKNIVERNEQVKIMGKIYSSAMSVLIWLGEENGETQLAYRCLEIFSEIPYKAQAGQKLDIPAADSLMCKAMRNLLARSWFKRAWTYQESALAREVNGGKQGFIFCGSFVVTADRMFAMALSSFYLSPLLRERLGLGDPENPEYLGTMAKSIARRFFRNQLSSCQLLDAICAIRGADCSDPRDLVYSIIGMDSEWETFEPDYASPVEDVFSDFAKTVIKKYCNLDILDHVTSHRRESYANRNGPLPTWVPDWRDDRSSSYSLHVAHLGTGEDSRKLYQATGSSCVAPGGPSNRNYLSVLGLRVDTVQEMCDSGPEGKLWMFADQYLTASGLTYSHSQGQPSDHPHNYLYTGDDLPIAFLRLSTLDASIGYNGSRFDALAHFEKLNNDEYKAKFTDSIRRRQQGRFLCFSRYSRIGLVPDDSQAGDLICLLLGGSVPYILRPAGDKYIFIGECFFLGLMDGEGLVEARKIADPTYNGEDISWLDRLHNEAVPFQAESFIIK